MGATNLIFAAMVASAPAAAMASGPLPAFDVAEDISRFVRALARVFEDGMPAYGSPFITRRPSNRSDRLTSQGRPRSAGVR